MNTFSSMVVCGMVATALVDVWSLVRRGLFGLPLPNLRLVGRWIGHFPRGRFVHDSIAASPPVRGEGAIGWIAHYAIGISFAALLAAVAGREWLEAPTLLPALFVGVATVAAPFMLMQPGMGLGFAASRAPKPGAARVQALVTHAIFGIGLYAGGLVVSYFNTGVS